MVEPTRGGVVDGGAPQAPPGLDTRERLGVAYYYRVGFTPAGRYVTHSLPASADSRLSPHWQEESLQPFGCVRFLLDLLSDASRNGSTGAAFASRTTSIGGFALASEV